MRHLWLVLVIFECTVEKSGSCGEKLRAGKGFDFFSWINCQVFHHIAHLLYRETLKVILTAIAVLCNVKTIPYMGSVRKGDSLLFMEL